MLFVYAQEAKRLKKLKVFPKKDLKEAFVKITQR